MRIRTAASVYLDLDRDSLSTPAARFAQLRLLSDEARRDSRNCSSRPAPSDTRWPAHALATCEAQRALRTRCTQAGH